RGEESAQPAEKQLGAEHGGCGRPALSVADPLGPEGRRGPPALGSQLVGLGLREKEPRVPVQLRPAALVILPEPAVVARLAERDRDEQAAVSPEHASQLAERGRARAVVA